MGVCSICNKDKEVCYVSDDNKTYCMGCAVDRYNELEKLGDRRAIEDSFVLPQ